MSEININEITKDYVEVGKCRVRVSFNDKKDNQSEGSILSILYEAFERRVIGIKESA